MTMPHLMNCDHSSDGWCLDCVKELWDDRRELAEAAIDLVESLPKWNFDSSCECVDCKRRKKANKVAALAGGESA